MTEQGLNKPTTYTTILQTGKCAKKVVYLHDKERLNESDIIWRIDEYGWTISTDGGKFWMGALNSQEDDKIRESLDSVNHPNHYTNRQHECIDEMVVVFGVDDVIAFCKCNAWKYRYRANNKGNYEEDMQKADWYISKAMELKERDKHNDVKCED